MKTTLALFTFLFLSTTTHALDLDEARSKKLVRELPSGYIEATDPKAKDLEKDVNAKRRTTYESIAKENKDKISVDQVGQQAAQKIKEKIGGK